MTSKIHHFVEEDNDLKTDLSNRFIIKLKQLINSKNRKFVSIIELKKLMNMRSEEHTSELQSH